MLSIKVVAIETYKNLIIELLCSYQSLPDHPPRTLLGFAPKFTPTLGFWHPSFCLGGRDLLGQLPIGRHLSINNVFHFGNFHYDGKNWQLTTLWGLLVALKFFSASFSQKIINIQLYISCKAFICSIV